MSRDSQTDAGRDGASQLRKGDDSGAYDKYVDVDVATLADEKWYYSPLNQPTAGTASDYAGLTSDLHRSQYERDPGANSTAPGEPSPLPDQEG